MRVALLCPTVGQTRRGYERFMTGLFAVLGEDVAVTMYKGGGEASANQTVVPHLRRTGALSRLFSNRLKYRRYQLEFATFSASLFPHLLRRDYDLVHFIDAPLARPLHAFRRWSGRNFRTLFTDAGPVSAEVSGWVDHVHYITPSAHRDALANGVSANRSTMAPVGVDAADFRTPLNREAVRAGFGISPQTTVILSVTTINRGHKRVDHLIEEAAGLRGDFLLWLDGSLHPDGDPSLLEFGRKRLGDRFRHTHLPSDRVGELYRAADVKVSSSLTESFGMALVEAQSAGTPVLAHDSPHFRWLLGEEATFADMRTPGAARRALQEVVESHGATPGAPSACRFDWSRLKESYLRLYRIAGAAV